MTVKCLNQEVKDYILARFNLQGPACFNDLAGLTARSRRTIIRVVEEANMDPLIRRRKPRRKLEDQPKLDIELPVPQTVTAWPEIPASIQPAANAETLAPQYVMPVTSSPVISSPQPQPWYRRVGQAITSLFG